MRIRVAGVAVDVSGFDDLLFFVLPDVDTRRDRKPRRTPGARTRRPTGNDSRVSAVYVKIGRRPRIRIGCYGGCYVVQKLPSVFPTGRYARFNNGRRRAGTRNRLISLIRDLYDTTREPC